MTRVTDEQKQEVLRLHFVEGLSTRRIAAQLQMARRTVRKVLSAPGTTPKPREPRVSQLAEHDAFLKAELAKTLSINAPAMLERLRARGYTGGISVLRERLRVLRPKPHAEVFSHFETRPGAELSPEPRPRPTDRSSKRFRSPGRRGEPDDDGNSERALGSSRELRKNSTYTQFKKK